MSRECTATTSMAIPRLTHINKTYDIKGTLGYSDIRCSSKINNPRTVINERLRMMRISIINYPTANTTMSRPFDGTDLSHNVRASSGHNRLRRLGIFCILGTTIVVGSRMDGWSKGKERQRQDTLWK
jgi:hypothetical protein